MNIQSLQSNQFNLVIESYDIEHDRIITIVNIVDILKKICSEYYVIRHYADVNAEGELKHDHYHAVIKLEKRIRKSTIIRLLANLLQVNECLISAEILYNKRNAVRYLLHKDHPDKYQYDECSIFTNNENQLFNYLHYDIDQLDTDRLIEVIKKCNFNKIEIMQVLGLQTYNTYWRMIEIILREYAIE